MHGLGNDFVVIDAINQAIALSADQLRQIADRKSGIGCDQILLIEKPSSPEIDFRYRIFNADGSEVAQCGNGARCFARFVTDQGLSDKNPISVETNTGQLLLNLKAEGWVTVNMGIPEFEPAHIPITSSDVQDWHDLNQGKLSAHFAVAQIGNPHAVILVDDADTAPVEAVGSWLEQHPFFPERVNVGFLQVIDRTTAKLRVFERGVGETQACGSGACAAVAIGVKLGWFDPKVNIQLLGGELTIEYAGVGKPIFLTGPTASIYHGTIEL